MKQKIVRNANGMATRFVPTQTINIRSLTENQLLRVFDQIQPDQPHHDLPLVLYNTRVRGRRVDQNQQAVMVSGALLNSLLAAAPAVLPLVRFTRIVDDFLLPEDRFSRALLKLTPRQEMKTLDEEIDPAGLVTTPDRFVDATLNVRAPLVPLVVSGAVSTITFNVADAGQVAHIEYVTVLEYPIIEIRRLAEQPSHITNVYQGTDAYLFHPSLAALLGLALPTL